MRDSGAAELDLKVSAARQLLAEAQTRHRSLVYASSLGPEAVVLTDLIASHAFGIDIFTIDTGRLHEETYEVLAQLQRRYPQRIRVVYPEAAALERLVSRQGVNGFYQSVEARLECCRVRKVEPFKRAIAGFGAWVTGIRRRQSPERARAEAIEWDAGNGLHRVSPLLDWSDEEIWQYIRTRQLPYNRLLDRGFSSIGCEPCTRAVGVGEDFRAGRWWWEHQGSRECGLVPKPRPAIPIVVSHA